MTPTAGTGTKGELGRVFGPGHLLLGVVLAVLLAALVLSSLGDARAERAQARRTAASDSASGLAVFTQRESFVLGNRYQAWLGGAVPRREVQVQRSLLQRRLDTTTDAGVSAASLAGPAYLAALDRLDQLLVESSSPGVVPAADQPRLRALLTPALEGFEEASTAIGVNYQRAADASARTAASERAAREQRWAVLLVVTLAVATTLALWSALSLRAGYRRAQQLIRADREELDRVSALERGEAVVLGRIVRGEPVEEVLADVLDLATGLSTRGLALRVGGELQAAGVAAVVWPRSAPEELRRSDPGGPESAGRLTFPVVGDEGAELARLELCPDGGPPDAALSSLLRRCGDIAALAAERHLSAVRLRHQATHDPLTGLPNRTLLLERVQAELDGAGAGGAPAVLFCDLDRFKVVNDSLGHRSGDRLLRGVARRLERAGDLPGVTLGRLGGDEFVAVCPGPTAGLTAELLATRIAAELVDPFTIAGTEVFVDASVGIAVAGPDTPSPEHLLRNADVAMYRSKQGARDRRSGRWVLYDEELESDVRERVATESSLRRAVADGDLRVHLQPVVDLGSGRTVGVEALVRWQRGDRLVGPGEFLPLAEEAGLIVDIGRYVLAAAVRAVSAHNLTSDRPPLSVAVNVSLTQLGQPGVAEWILSTLAAAGLPSHLLVLELTEHALVEVGEVGAVLERLRGAGVRVAMDDFGTGYSSLVQLGSLPVDIVKLDRAFVAALADGGSTARSVLAAAVSLVDAVGAELVVEGIETDAELAELRALGCRFGQGYLLGRPGAPEAVLADASVPVS